MGNYEQAYAFIRPFFREQKTQFPSFSQIYLTSFFISQHKRLNFNFNNKKFEWKLQQNRLYEKFMHAYYELKI